MSAAVEVRGLSKSYGRRPAVRDLDLDVGYGEIFAILGPNGAGKTTTVEILEGNRRRDSGEVLVLGEDPGRAGRQWRARIGIVLQEVSDAGMLTVGETVQMFSACYGTARAPADVLELVGLRHASRSRVRTLSGGSGAGSTSRSASSAGPNWCSSTNRRQVSIPRRANSSGN